MNDEPKTVESAVEKLVDNAVLSTPPAHSPDNIPQEGIFRIYLDCGHSRKCNMARKTTREPSLSCGKCEGKPRKNVVRYEFIRDAEAEPEPVEEREDDEHQPEKDFETHISSLRARLSEKDRELASAQGQIKTYVDTIAAKDMALRKYLTQISNLTDSVQRAELDVKTMKNRQESWQQEQIELDAEEHARDIENHWKPQIEIADTRARIAQKNLQKELNSPVVISAGHMVKVMNFLKKGSTFCHIRRQNGKIIDVVQGRPMLHLTHELVGSSQADAAASANDADSSEREELLKDIPREEEEQQSHE